MSCTAPVNINSNIEDFCDQKCDYRFSYETYPSLTVTNAKNILVIKSANASNTPTVRYNNKQYKVDEVLLFQPSLHTYDGEHAPAEMVITHYSLSGGNPLFVCVPLVVDGSSLTDSVSLLDSIIAKASQDAATPYKRTSVDIDTFSLNAFVPKQPFYSYEASFFMKPCNNNNLINYIVFSPLNNGMKTISTDAYDALTELIEANTLPVVQPGGGLYYNKFGPKSLDDGKVSDGLYMECQPTGADGEVIVPNQQTSAQVFNFTGIKALFKNVLFQALVGILLIYGLMRLGDALLHKLSDKTSASDIGKKSMLGGAGKLVGKGARKLTSGARSLASGAHSLAGGAVGGTVRSLIGGTFAL
jgi:carbonic anhydrase